MVVENCEITGNGNGVFVNTRNDAEEDASRHIVIRNNQIYANGTPGSYYGSCRVYHTHGMNVV